MNEQRWTGPRGPTTDTELPLKLWAWFGSGAEPASPKQEESQSLELLVKRPVGSVTDGNI